MMSTDQKIFCRIYRKSPSDEARVWESSAVSKIVPFLFFTIYSNYRNIDGLKVILCIKYMTNAYLLAFLFIKQLFCCSSVWNPFWRVNFETYGNCTLDLQCLMGNTIVFIAYVSAIQDGSSLVCSRLSSSFVFYYFISSFLLFPFYFLVLRAFKKATNLVLNLKALQFLNDSVFNAVFIIVNVV